MVNMNTAITIGMKSLLAGIVTFVVSGALVLWAVLTFVIGGSREDVSAIRQSLDRTISQLQTVDRDGLARSNDINQSLGKEITDLKVETAKLTAQLGVFGVRLDTTNKSVETLNSGLSNTNKSVEFLSSQLGGTIKSIESLGARLSTTSKAMDDLSMRLDKFQTQLISISSPEIDSKRIAPVIDALRKNGVSEERIIIIPVH
jgi:septal ring factor EnvC (AmiA/AmiB activator)